MMTLCVRGRWEGSALMQPSPGDPPPDLKHTITSCFYPQEGLALLFESRPKSNLTSDRCLPERHSACYLVPLPCFIRG